MKNIDRTKPSTYLDACKIALNASQKPMSSRELVEFIRQNLNFSVRGHTPWKTVNARLSADIIQKGKASDFVRTHDGVFALRDWPGVREHTVKRRVLNPTDETIAVVPVDLFKPLLRARHSSVFYDIDYVELFWRSSGMKRLDAEDTEDFVQIVPLFFIYNSSNYLTYKRTKRLPEKRLHGTRSINFGGHLQTSDFPALFSKDASVVDEALQRELREEVQLLPDVKTVRFFGAIYDTKSMFGRQHIGLVFEVASQSQAKAHSNEPGFLASMEFLSKSDIYARRLEFDDWTFLVLEEHEEWKK